MKRRVLAWMIATAMLLTSIPGNALTAYAQETEEGLIMEAQEQAAPASAEEVLEPAEDSEDNEKQALISEQAEDTSDSSENAEDIVISEDDDPDAEEGGLFIEEDGEDADPAAVAEDGLLTAAGDETEDAQSVMDSAIPIQPGVPVEAVWAAGQETGYYYSFTPEEDGTYVFYSEVARDTKAYLYEYTEGATALMSIADDDDSGDGNNFLIQYDVTAGTTYIFQALPYSSSDEDETSTVTLEVCETVAVTWYPQGGTWYNEETQEQTSESLTTKELSGRDFSGPISPEYPDESKGFIGWSMEPGGEVWMPAYDSARMPDDISNLELYAVYADMIIVTLNGGEGAQQFAGYDDDNLPIYEDNPAKVYTTPAGRLLTLSADEFFKEGCIITGWQVEGDSEQVYPADLSESFEQSVTLNAIWEDASSRTITSVAISQEELTIPAYQLWERLSDLSVTVTYGDDSEEILNNWPINSNNEYFEQSTLKGDPVYLFMKDQDGNPCRVPDIFEDSFYDLSETYTIEAATGQNWDEDRGEYYYDKSSSATWTVYPDAAPEDAMELDTEYAISKATPEGSYAYEWRSFTATEEGTYKVTASGSWQGVYIYRKNEDGVWESDDSLYIGRDNENARSRKITLAADEKILIAVTGPYSYWEEAEYTPLNMSLKVEKVVRTITPIDAESWYTAQIEEAGDDAWFSFTPEEDGFYSVGVSLKVGRCQDFKTPELVQ